MTDFLTSPEFLTAGMWAFALLAVLVLIFGIRDTLRRPIKAGAATYTIAHRMNEITPGGMK